MRKLRLAIFSDNFYPEISGISDSIIRTACELGKLGHVVRFYVPKHPKKNYLSANLPFKEVELVRNISVFRIVSLPFRTGTGQGRAVIPSLSLLSDIKKFNPDVIHVHLPFGAGIFGLAASRILKIPLIGTNHTPLSEFIRYSPIRGKLTKKLILKYDSNFYNCCNFVSSPSASIFSEMKKYGFSKNHEVVANPIEREQAPRVSKNVLKKRYRFSEFTVLYSGRLAKEKNIDLVIMAVAEAREKIKSLNLAITGRGSYEKELRILVSKLGISDFVRFLGFLPNKNLAEVYKASDIFAVMSAAETQCLAAMKAMNYGLPVMASDSWGLREYVNSKNGFLIKQGDFQELAKKIIFLCKNKTVRENLGKQGQKDVRKFYPENIAKKWERIYINSSSD